MKTNEGSTIQTLIACIETISLTYRRHEPSLFWHATEKNQQNTTHNNAYLTVRLQTENAFEWIDFRTDRSMMHCTQHTLHFDLLCMHGASARVCWLYSTRVSSLSRCKITATYINDTFSLQWILCSQIQSPQTAKQKAQLISIILLMHVRHIRSESKSHTNHHKQIDLG